MSKPQAWLRKEDEPNLWYQRFEFFLRMGSDRSLLASFNAWKTEKSTKVLKGRKNYVPGSWRRACEEWHWVERAEAYDRFQSDRTAAATEDAAKAAIRILKQGSENAARVLVKGLEDPEITTTEDGKTIIAPAVMKYQIESAEAILDRVGVPRATRQEIDLGTQKVKGYVEISPDDWDDDEDTDEA